MKILDYLKDNILYLDGGSGTLLQEAGLPTGELPERWCLSHPDVVTAIHRSYYDAGANVVYANTFGANSLKFSDTELDSVISAAISCAKTARDTSSFPGEKYIALDIGPTGKLLKPLGDLDFEDAVNIFKKTVALGKKYGADLVVIETMNDCYETKAALLAVREECDLPVFVTNAYGEDGKLMTGASPSAMAALLEGMGADAVGVNCSLGLKALEKVTDELLLRTDLPIILKPNAGLPSVVNGKTVYDVAPDEFAEAVVSMIRRGVRIVGGCCGTTPEYIRRLRQLSEGLAPVKPEKKNITCVSSYTHTVDFSVSPILIGERLNPTGKKLMKEALRNGNIDYLLNEAIGQADAGAHILDINVGLPDIDEKNCLSTAVREIQAVCDLPLQIDTAAPAAMEASLRLYNGKPLINSVNGKEESLSTVLPLAKKYGGVLIALTLDEKGIPDTAEGRLSIAKKIIDRARDYGIEKKDIIFDPLCMAQSADSAAASVTLASLRLIGEKTGCKTSLGVSNISFGLPDRDCINSAFFISAMEAGLSAAIMNPYSERMLDAYRAFRVLHGLDENCGEYISSHESTKNSITTADETLTSAVEKGLKERAVALTAELLKTKEPMSIINEYVIPALDQVGRGFEQKKVYLPQLLMAAEAAKGSFETVKAALPTNASVKYPVVLATVHGDIHDIGKNIVKLLLENYGYDVHDLGRDVPPEKILSEAKRTGAPVVGLSALMTTTVPAMEETVKLLHRELPHVKTVVGGAVLTEEYAKAIGADKYAADAMETVRFCDNLSD